MNHEDIIDWNNIESIFEEDDMYENINAPKWVDLSAPSQTIDDEAWFCKPGCKHPKCVEDYLKPKHSSKVKLLRSRTISEILPFRDRTPREAKGKNGEKGSKPAQKLNEDNENKNPNISSTPPLLKKLTKKPQIEEKTDQCDDSRENSVKSDMKKKKKKGLKSTFSARNLVGGRDILSQISELCSELKKMATKGSKMGGSSSTKGCDDGGGVLGELKERVRERERRPFPLLAVKR